MPDLVIRSSFIVHRKKAKLQTTNQSGFSGVILPLFLLAAIGISVYLVQQRTNLIPFAQQQTQPPPGCRKITTSLDTREVQWEDLNDNTNGPFRKSRMEKEGEGALLQQQTWQKYAFKKVRWTWTGGWKDTGKKIWAGDSGQGPNYTAPNGDSVQWDRVGFGSAPTRWDSPDGKIYYGRGSNAPITGAANDGIIREVVKATDNEGAIVVFSKFIVGTNYQGVTTNPDGTAAKTFDPTGSYAFVPDNPKAGTDCSGGGGNGLKGVGESCTDGPKDCKSGVCTNGKCTDTGTKAAGTTCEKGTECKSGTCTNNKCADTGTKAGGAGCTSGAECQSGTCTNNKCAGGSTVTGRACNENSDCASNKCVNNKCVAVSASPSPSSRPSPSTTASAGPIASASAVPLPSGTTVVSLTKAEIIGFKGSFDALNARLNPASSSGNLNIVSGIAKNELESIVSALPTCPDDANVGKCVDEKFRTRFGLAKTAARLSAFYAIFNNIPGICVKADIGLNPLIAATSQAGTMGRVNLCNDRLVASKLWMVFLAGKFTPILSTDSRFPANPTCATLPADVRNHYRNAEGLFKTQAGFIENTLCDGKTSVAPEDGTPASNNTSYPSQSICDGSCPIATKRCGLSRLDFAGGWYCLPKGIFNKDFYCSTGEFGNNCPSSHPTCDSTGVCRNSANTPYPGTPNVTP